MFSPDWSITSLSNCIDPNPIYLTPLDDPDVVRDAIFNERPPTKCRTVKGNKDHPNACLVYKLYCLANRKPFNLSYYMAKRITGVIKSDLMVLSYGMLLTRFYRHVLTIQPCPTTNPHYLMNHVMVPLTKGRVHRPIRRIQDFDESKDHCLTLKNMPYPHQRYAIYITLVNKEKPTGFTLICRIHQEDTAYPCLYFIRNHEELKSYTPYPGASIRRIQGAIGEWFKKDCIGSVTTWEDLVEKFVQKFYQLTDHNEEIEAEEDDDPNDITDIFKIEGNLFDYETPFCKAFKDFNYLLKINTDLVGSMTYFQDHKWYDELADGKLKEETLMHKAKVEEPLGNTTLSVMKLCAWLINSFGNFHELDYNVLVKLQECWWKINAHEVARFTRLESYGHRPYADFKTEKARVPYLEINNIFGRNYDTSLSSQKLPYRTAIEPALDGV
ncbi:hypothetical protein Tco_0987298 [Tanacetum coccineum]